MSNWLSNASETKRYFIDSTPHREDGPAVIYPNGTEYWYVHGQLHRTTGPAITLNSGATFWYLNNQRITSRALFQEQANLTDEDMIALILKYGDIE